MSPLKGKIMSRIPYRWADWAFLETRVRGFIKWASEAPEILSDERYAIVDNDGIRWARVSPNPDVPVAYSSGCFYDDMVGGAIEAARIASLKHGEKVRALVDG
jgi:hypothetical protein